MIRCLVVSSYCIINRSWINEVDLDSVDSSPETSIYQPTIPHLAFVIQKSYPSIEAFALFLGAVWLCVDLRSAETFELSAIMFFTWFYVTHVSILTSDFSKTFSKISSSKYRTFCYQSTVWRDWWIKLLYNQRNVYYVTICWFKSWNSKLTNLLILLFRWMTLAPIHLRRF